MLVPVDAVPAVGCDDEAGSTAYSQFKTAPDVVHERLALSEMILKTDKEGTLHCAFAVCMVTDRAIRARIKRRPRITVCFV